MAQEQTRAKRRWWHLVFAPLLLVLLGACTVAVRVPETPAPRNDVDALAHWTRVLNRFVDEQGRVDFVGLAQERGALDAYVAWVAAVSPHNAPERFPTTGSQLAFHINSYNALSMYNVLEAGLPRSLSGLKKVHFFVLRKLVVGGRRISLYDYENDVIRPLGDPRVHFALNCMVVSCPRLPRKPFAASTVDQALDTQARQFFGETRNLRVDHGARTVTFSEILAFYREDFLAVEPSVQAYARRYHDGPVPDEYAVRFTPYDWRVNHQR